MGTLAAAMCVTPGTATSMVKALADAKLVIYEPREGVKLTTSGQQLALHVLRRHRLVELFLVEVLGLNWSEVHEEAENLEHTISDRVLDRIDALLGHPTVDPHGDPIPNAHGKISEPSRRKLVDCEVATSYRISRIADQDPEFLRLMEQRGLMPGRVIKLKRHEAAADSITVELPSREETSFGFGAAAKIHVEAIKKRR